MFSLRTSWNIALGMATKNRPFYVQYYILSRCNLVCRQCNIVESNSDLKDASLATIEKIADNLVKVGAGVVLLTGGEPFLRKDLPEIVKIFSERGLSPRLQTAGLKTTREELEACRAAGAKDINISLDSLIEAKQDYINGSIPNSWRRAVECIVEANEVFDSPDRICAFGTVLSKLNYMEIPALLELATFLGWYQSLVPVHITTSSEPFNFRGVDSEMRFDWGADKDRLLDLKNQLKLMKRNKFNLFDSDAYIDSMFHFIEHNRPNWRKNDICDSPNLYFAILPNGDYATCCDHRYQDKLSVADPDFPEIFYSRDFRQKNLITTSACSGCNYGSYPEITLSVRDPEAIFDRMKKVILPKRNIVVKRTKTEVFEFIEELILKYKIPEYDGPRFKVKPPATSQGYGQLNVIQRGKRTE